MLEKKKRRKSVKDKPEEVSVIANFNLEQQDDIKEEDWNNEFPVLPLRNMIVFPSIIMPVNIGRKSTYELVKSAFKKRMPVVLASQIEVSVDTPELEDLYPMGVVGKIIRIFELPGGNTTAVVHTDGPRVILNEITSRLPYLMGKVSKHGDDILGDPKDKEYKLVMNTCMDVFRELIDINDDLNREFTMAMKELDNDATKINFICSNIPIPLKDKYKLFEIDTIKERTLKLTEYLSELLEMSNLKREIQLRTKEDLEKQQREYFLQQQIKNIQDGVIFIVNSSNMSIASKIKEMGVPYILVSDSCEVDLTDRTTLLEFIFSHHNKKVPKYLDEIKDVLDYGTFYELVKIYWVSGSWVLKEYNPANAFIEFIDSFNTIKKSEFIGKVINLMDICPVKVLESMLLSFLLKVNNPDTPIKGSYGKAILSFRKNKHIPVDEAVLKSLSSPVDNEYLRLFNFIISLKY